MESKKTFIETQAPATENPLSKEVVLKIGREIRKAYFPILREIIDAVNQVAPSYNFEIPSEVRKQIYATSNYAISFLWFQTFLITQKAQILTSFATQSMPNMAQAFQTWITVEMSFTKMTRNSFLWTTHSLTNLFG